MDRWGAVLDALSLTGQKTTKLDIVEIQSVLCGVLQLTNWLESEFIEEQVKEIKKLSEYVATLTRVGSGLGEHLFDRETLGSHCH